MEISKTKINKRMKKKTNPELVETLLLAKKVNPELAKILSGPTRKRITKNLDEINKESKEGGTVIVPGKVLGDGELTKKIRIIALGFSESALKKLKDKSTILEELKKGKITGKILI